MNVAVIGSRGYTDRAAVVRWFGENWHEAMHLLSGGAPGVDSWAAECAAIHGDEPTVIRPDYKTYPAAAWGKDFAPKLRNKMIVDGASIVVAFWDGRSTGTAHAIAWAVYRGKTIVIRYAPGRADDPNGPNPRRSLEQNDAPGPKAAALSPDGRTPEATK